MIEARHWAPFEATFGWYVRGLFRRRFHAVWVRGNVPDTDEPLMLVKQHVAWWDPLLLLHLSRVWMPRAPHYVMMDEANLRNIRFFRWLGAFGVDRGSRAGATAAMKYVLKMARRPRARIVVYPQGEQQPMDRRPLVCQPGASWIAARAGLKVIPVAVRYEFLEDEHPDCFVSIGASHPPPARDDAGAIERILTAEADALRDAVHGERLADFTRVTKGSGSRDPRGVAAGAVPVTAR